MSSPFDDLLKQIPIGDIAEQVGVDNATASLAIAQILPTLVGGMAANVQDEKGADSLTKALSAHQGKLNSRKSVKNIDKADGEKIVNHVFGSKKDEVVKATGTKGVGSDIIAQILPIVAPIALAWIANQFFGGDKESSTTKSKKKAPADTAGGIGDLLGGLLGGSSGGGGDLLGGLIGGLLGGKK